MVSHADYTSINQLKINIQFVFKLMIWMDKQ